MRGNNSRRAPQGCGGRQAPRVPFVPTGTKRRRQAAHTTLAWYISAPLLKARVKALAVYPCAVAPVLASVCGVAVIVMADKHAYRRTVIPAFVQYAGADALADNIRFDSAPLQIGKHMGREPRGRWERQGLLRRWICFFYRLSGEMPNRARLAYLAAANMRALTAENRLHSIDKAHAAYLDKVVKRGSPTEPAAVPSPQTVCINNY